MIDESTKEKLRKLKVDEMIDSLEGLDNTLRNEEISFDESSNILSMIPIKESTIIQ